MLNTTIEIWPYGFSEGRQPIAHIAIWNQGTYFDDGVQYADYGYAITVEYDDRFFEPVEEPLTDLQLRDIARMEAFDDDQIRAHGVIRKHRRWDGATVLLGKVLADAGLAS